MVTKTGGLIVGGACRRVYGRRTGRRSHNESKPSLMKSRFTRATRQIDNQWFVIAAKAARGYASIECAQLRTHPRKPASSKDSVQLIP